MRTYSFPLDLVRERSPERPVALVRPRSVSVAARWFQDNLNADVFYAVKANPSRWVIETLVEAGVTGFDVASLAEIELVRSVSADARLAFMHPVKSRGAITRAYFEYGVRTFSLDSHDELAKILDATGNATDLNLLVRMTVSADGAAYSLSGKFGVSLDQAPSLLLATRQAVKDGLMGVCFHVGSQCMRPSAYEAAMAQVGRAISRAGVFVDIVDVGGGFPRSIRAWSRRTCRNTPTPSIAASTRCRFRKRPSCGASPAGRSSPRPRRCCAGSTSARATPCI